MNFLYTYNKLTGLFEQIIFAGRQYLNQPMEVNIWRAPTDNDMYIKTEWKRAHYDQAYTRAYRSTINQNKAGVVIHTAMSVLAASIQRLISIDVVWTIDNSGGISAEIKAVRHAEFPELPRFGLRLFLNSSLENVSYYGMGPNESYVDKCRSSSHGLYQAKVAEMHEDYIRPQENGSHNDCDYVMLTNNQFGLAAVSHETFSFNASKYTQEELEKKVHNYELEESESTVLCLDYAQNGIGSNSCGPKVMDKYKLNDDKFTFHIKLVPFVKA
jgi:beta-galactosidase